MRLPPEIEIASEVTLRTIFFGRKDGNFIPNPFVESLPERRCERNESADLNDCVEDNATRSTVITFAESFCEVLLKRPHVSVEARNQAIVTSCESVPRGQVFVNELEIRSPFGAAPCGESEEYHQTWDR